MLREHACRRINTIDLAQPAEHNSPDGCGFSSSDADQAVFTAGPDFIVSGQKE